MYGALRLILSRIYIDIAITLMEQFETSESHIIMKEHKKDHTLFHSHVE